MDASLDRLCTALSAENMLRELEPLVLLNSHSANVGGVLAVGTRIQHALHGTCLALQQTPGNRFAPHLCFSTPAADRAAPILLIGHHDTVFPPGSFEGFRRAGNFAYGPGVLDMKGGLVIVIEVLRALDAAGVLATIPLRFITVSDEEVGSPESQAWLGTLAQNALCALVFEAGRAGDAIITARRGSGYALVTAHGKAAHAGNALAEGRNAIWALARFIDHTQSQNGRIAGASFNVGLVRGGSARNTVASEASCEVDLRFADSQGEAALHRALQQAARQAELDVAGTQLDVSWHVSRRPWSRSAATAALYARYAACQEAAGLGASEAPPCGGGSDANTVGALGLATLDGLGPRGRGFHTHEEEIEISSLSMKAEALLRFIWSCRKPFRNADASLP